MKTEVSIIFFTAITILVCFSSQVNSQTDETCESKLNLNSILFDTTNLKCLQVWESQNFILRFGPSESNSSVWSFVLSVRDPGSFVAMGFSKSGFMVGSSAVVGWVSNGTPQIKQYFLGGTTPTQVQPDQGELALLPDTATALVGPSNRVYVAFQLAVGPGEAAPSNRLIYSVGPQGFYPVAPNFRLQEHRSKVQATINYDLGRASSSKSSPHLGLRRSHGVFNMLGWGILMVIGVMVARYCRHRDPLWFYLHVGIQSTGLLMGITGVLCGFLLDSRLHVDVSTHKGIGIFVFVLGCMQAMALLARPHKTAKNRKYWNWIHYGIGRVLIVFAISNVFHGIKLGSEGKGWSVSYALALCFLFVASCVLEYRLWSKNEN